MTNDLANPTATHRISRCRFARANGAQTIFFGAMLALAMCAPTGAGASTISFQDGVSPSGTYAGETDRQFYSGTPDTGYTRTNMDLQEQDPNHSRDVVRFDLSSLPISTTVTSATLTIYQFNGDTGDATSLYTVNPAEPWNVATASWDSWDTGHAWSVPGLAAPADYSSSAVGTATTPGTGQFMTFTLSTAAIQDWISNPGDNAGFFMQMTASGFAQFAAALYATPADRPVLTLTVANVPEPGTVSLFALGAIGILLTAARNRRKGV